MLLLFFLFIFIGRFIGAQGVRLLRDERANYMKILLARHATRNLNSLRIAFRRRSTCASARLLMAQSGRRLTALPVESEQPGSEINYYQKHQCIRKQPIHKKNPASMCRQDSFPLLCFSLNGIRQYSCK